MLSTIADYQRISKDMNRSLKITAKKPDVSRETQYYLTHIGKVTSIDDFLKDYRLYSYAMKAFGLSEMTYAKAFMRKVLTEGTDKTDSFANTLSDKRYQQFAETFNFVRYGVTTTIFDRTRQGTVDAYVRQTLEEDAGARNEGVRLALYFNRKAGDIKSAYGILADPALLKVVQTALAIPAATSAMDIDRQAQMIAARLNVADLKDPSKLGKFLSRFASLWDLDNPATMPASSTLNLFTQPLEAGIGVDVLATLQNLKLGGH